SKLYGPAAEPGALANPVSRVELVGQPHPPHHSSPTRTHLSRGLDPTGLLVGDAALSRPRPISKSHSFGLLSLMPAPSIPRVGLDGAVLNGPKDGIAVKSATKEFNFGDRTRRRTVSPDAPTPTAKPLTLDSLDSLCLSPKIRTKKNSPRERPTSWIGSDSNWLPNANWLSSLFSSSTQQSLPPKPTLDQPSQQTTSLGIAGNLGRNGFSTKIPSNFGFGNSNISVLDRSALLRNRPR
uniref:CG11280 n=2 Tax=Bursaphelenchus xylophilus TaxID=6326 RepID=A0A1I7SHH7_BURXY